MSAPWHLNGRIFSRRASGSASLPPPSPGEIVHVVVLGERSLGDTSAAWTDSYRVSKDGGAPKSFLARAAGRIVWDWSRGKEFRFVDAVAAERAAANAIEDAGW
jgi:hypothetical protein